MSIVEASEAKARLRLWLRLLKTQRIIETEIRERLRAGHETTLPRFDVMAALHRAEDGLKMSELSGALRVSNGNVTGIVERLVQDGLIAREPVPGDRRAMLVKLTPEGRRVFEGMAAEHESWVDEMLAGIGGADADKLADRLNALAEAVERKAP